MRIQSPVQSGFNPSTTAVDVITDLNLAGKIAIITGGHSGLGLESTKALVASGANVIVGARNVTNAKNTLLNIPNVIVKELDLSDITSIKRFSDEIINSKIHVDMLFCNAGVMACPETRVHSGWEIQFAVNHIGHYLLTNLIWGMLNPGSRVVCVSSAGHHVSPIRWNDIHFEKEKYDKWVAYGQSKTANALFALQLDEYGKKHNIRAFSLHPGKIFTPLQRYLSVDEMISAGWLDHEGNPLDPTFKTPEQGAATQVWAATSPKLKNMGGLYCEDCDISKSASEYTESFRGVRDYAADPDEAKRLWELTEHLTGINVFK